MNKILTYCLLILFVSCSTVKNRHVYERKIKRSRLLKLSSWKWIEQNNLANKVSSTLSQEEERLLNLLKDAYSLSPAKGTIPSNIAVNNYPHIFRKALLNVPKEVQNFLNDHIKKFFLVKGLGVSTLTIQLKDENKKNTGQFISFLDVDVLNQKINDWYKWRESTAFKRNNDFSFTPHLSYKNTVTDTSQMAISYLVAIILNWNPIYFPISKESYFLTPKRYEFLNQSWELKENIVTPLEKGLSEDLHYLRYYTKGEPLFSTKEQSGFYKELEKTNFINLFSLMGSAKDFIESVANYIYVEKLNHPYSVKFYKNKKLINKYESCWQKSRCQQKRKIIQKILEKEIYSKD